MTRESVMEEVMRGGLLLVGEYRGSLAEEQAYIDRVSGEKINYIRAMHLIECIRTGKIDRAVIYERLLNVFSLPEVGEFPYAKGSRMVFLLESANWKNNQMIGFLLKGTKPELVEEDGSEAGGAAAMAPSGAASPRSGPNLVLLPTTPHPTP